MSDIVGEIALELNLDSDKFKKSLKNLNKTADNAAESMKNSFSGAFKKIAGAAAAAFSAAAVIKFGKDCVESAASVNAANSQLAQTFGDLQGNAEAAMKKVADSSGIVQSRLQGVGTSIYAFAKTTGMDSANALSMMEEALQVTADSAAYYDRSLEDTAESLKSFLKGNYENDAALGLSCTETTRNTAANKLYGKSFQNLSEAQKQLTLLQMVKDANRLSGAMGQAAREANGWENVIGNLKEAWNQFLAVIGQPILQAAVTVIQRITSAIQTLTEYAKMASGALGELFGWSGNNTITASVSSAASSAGALSSSTAESADNLKKSTKAAEKLKKAVAGFDQLNILSADTDTSESDDTSVSDTVNNAVIPVVSSASNLKSDENAYNKFGDTVKKVFEKINKAIEPVKKSLGRLKEQLDRLGKFAWEGLKNFYTDFLEPVGKWVLGEGLPRFIDAISQMMSNIDWDKVNSAFDELWKALAPFAINVGEGLLWFVENVLSPLGAWTMNEVVPAFLHILSGAISIVNKIIEKAKPTFEWLWKNFLDPIAKWTGGIIVTVLNAIGDALNWIAGNEYAVDVITAFGIAAGTSMGGIVASTAASITWLWNNCEWFKNGWTTVWNSICNVTETVWNAISEFFINAWNNISAVWNTVVEFFQGIWGGICNVFNAVASWFQEIFEQASNAIHTVVDPWVEIFRRAWELIQQAFEPVVEWFKNLFTQAWESIKTAWSGVINFFSGIWNGIETTFSAVGTWFSDTFIGAWNNIKKAFEPVTKFFSGIWDGIKNTFSKVSEWFGNTFKKAWEAVKNVFSVGGKIFDGIKDGILNGLKAVVNAIITGINKVIEVPFNGINYALQKIKDVNILGVKPFDWIQTISVPQIPKLAKGGLATAPTLAMVGDNPNASSDPEVISPLSKLKGMITETQQTTVCDERIIRMLQKIYDLLSNEETQYINNTYVDGELIDRKVVKVRKRKNRRYGGVLT